MSNRASFFSVVATLLLLAPASAVGKEKAGGPAADPSRIEVLNNLVSELMDAGKRGLLGRREITFVTRRQGWRFFALAGDAAMTLGAEGQPLVVAKGSRTAEAMRYLPAGRHTLRLAGQATKLVVRAIPALVFNCFPAPSTIAPFGAPSWQSLQKTVLANCNTIEGYASSAQEMAEWRGQGKQWVVCSLVRGGTASPWRTLTTTGAGAPVTAIH